MDLSEEDRKRLDRLMEQHLNGDLSDEEYQKRSWEVLKEKESPLSPRLQLGSKSKSGRLSQSVSQDDLQRLEKRQNRPRRRLLNTLLPLLLVFAFGIGLALVVGLVRSASDAGRNPPIPVPSPLPPADIEPEPITSLAANEVGQSLYFKPTFGDRAVQVCVDECTATREGSARMACQRDCGALSLSRYGRRITLGKLDAERDAAKLMEGCLNTPLSLKSHSSGIKWEEEIESSANLLNQAHLMIRRAEAGSILRVYEDLISATRTLRSPPGGGVEETQATELLARASCLRAGVTLAEAGIAMAKARSDRFSEHYYLKYRTALDENSAPHQHAALAAVRKLGMFSYE